MKMIHTLDVWVIFLISLALPHGREWYETELSATDG